MMAGKKTKEKVYEATQGEARCGVMRQGQTRQGEARLGKTGEMS